MSKTRNSKEWSDKLQALAQSLVDQQAHDSLSPEAAKALRATWQIQMEEKSGCAPATARNHIAKALRQLRYKEILSSYAE